MGGGGGKWYVSTPLCHSCFAAAVVVVVVAAVVCRRSPVPFRFRFVSVCACVYGHATVVCLTFHSLLCRHTFIHFTSVTLCTTLDAVARRDRTKPRSHSVIS